MAAHNCAPSSGSNISPCTMQGALSDIAVERQHELRLAGTTAVTTTSPVGLRRQRAEPPLLVTRNGERPGGSQSEKAPLAVRPSDERQRSSRALGS